jgi:hypothetical protein
MPLSASEVRVQFRPPPNVLFAAQCGPKLDANAITLRLQPNEGISIDLLAKRPGLASEMQRVEMTFNYQQAFGNGPATDAYERARDARDSGDPRATRPCLPGSQPRRPVWLRIVFVFFAALAAGAISAAPAFPVKHSANQRHLVDQNGVPFPIMGRAAWYVLSLSGEDYHTFIDDTAARGYSAIEFKVITHDPRANNPPFNGNSDLPFLKRLDGSKWPGSLSYGKINSEAPDFTTPNETYWRFVDAFLAYCESRGLLVFLFPAYVGARGGDEGWMQEVVANGPAKMQSYGAWIANRYKNQKNLIWMAGGDLGKFSTAQSIVENALLTGLKSVVDQQSVEFSAEWESETIATEQAQFGYLMTLNGAYTWSGAVNRHGRRAYSHTPTLPAFLLEGPYDEEGPDGNSSNPSATQPVRRFQWWGWLSTIGGYISGNGYVWRFKLGWQSHLNSRGTQDMARLNAFMRSIAWYNLVPSGVGGMRTLITVGGSSVNAPDYVAAAATPDGSLLVAYIPPAHTGSIAVNRAAISGPARACWFDPTSGVYSNAGSGLAARSGRLVFAPPGVNSAGANDWVLVLQTGPLFQIQC